MGITVSDILRQCEAELQEVDSPRLSAQVLVGEVLGLSRLGLSLERERRLTDQEHERIRSLVLRRASGEPVAYILGQKEFYGLDFMVTPDVLIPRPETEHIIEAVEERFAPETAFRFADLGTGSGILAVTLTHLFPNATAVAVDKSPNALKVARNNARMHGVADRIAFVQGDFTTSLLDAAAFDLVVSNPPYVTEKEYDDASHEVTDFEPVEALVSGADGLDHIRAMLPLVFRALVAGGLFLIEIGCGQGEAVQIITTDECPGFRCVTIIKDLAGHDRVVLLQKT
jgi:protein-(glutamine-N5) methyltransferase, release factor-specific